VTKRTVGNLIKYAVALGLMIYVVWATAIDDDRSRCVNRGLQRGIPVMVRGADLQAAALRGGDSAGRRPTQGVTSFATEFAARAAHHVVSSR